MPAAFLGPQHYNPFGVVHGGFASTLLDLVLGHVSVTELKDVRKGVSTTDLTVKYLRPIYQSTGEVRCEGTVLKAGRRVIVSEATLRDSAGRLCA